MSLVLVLPLQDVILFCIDLENDELKRTCQPVLMMLQQAFVLAGQICHGK